MIFESYPVVGYNYRMTDMQAAIGREQLKRLPAIVGAAAAPGRSLPRCSPVHRGLEAPREPAWARSNWQSYCVRLAPDLDQRMFMQGMLDRGIATRRGA